MKFPTSLKMIAGATAFTAVAGMAAAAPVDYAALYSTGSYYYDGSVPTVTFTDPDAHVALTASGAALDRDEVLSFKLRFEFMAASPTFDDPTVFGPVSYNDTVDLGSFSINQMLAAVGTGHAGGATFDITSYSFPTATTMDVNGSVTLDEVLTAALAGAVGAPSNFTGINTGQYSLNAWLQSDIAPVPLPAAAPLLLFGIGGLVALGRKRRKAA
ncbi:VPLPA-CTERM sorting domain-containing protein [Roseovarius spongiae]|uniref:VPLPA-CTERM sorting domain-containing protein n=1 Tax=Roseovarius spongiae TaxID=2320272 RepID=A0A3A8ARA2_9RHOB|nr:VPLPA-CTERM sorting domain-containing protein [Roseovarius spongiae]RKF13400.1 VPLPA-CTERM sorting domain-containing protein [Roseovarius spongiae]